MTTYRLELVDGLADMEPWSIGVLDRLVEKGFFDNKNKINIFWDVKAYTGERLRVYESRIIAILDLCVVW